MKRKLISTLCAVVLIAWSIIPVCAKSPIRHEHEESNNQSDQNFCSSCPSDNLPNAKAEIEADNYYENESFTALFSLQNNAYSSFTCLEEGLVLESEPIENENGTVSVTLRKVSNSTRVKFTLTFVSSGGEEYSASIYGFSVDDTLYLSKASFYSNR